MLSEEYIGYDIRLAKKLLLLVKLMECWSVYSVDTSSRVLLVLDPTHTSDADSISKDGHRLNAKLLLCGLVSCFNNLFPDWDIDRSGWSVVGFEGEMHPSCDREDSAI